MKKLFKQAVGESQYGVDGLAAFLFAIIATSVVSVCIVVLNALGFIKEKPSNISVCVILWIGIVVALIPFIALLFFIAD